MFFLKQLLHVYNLLGSQVWLSFIDQVVILSDNLSVFRQKKSKNHLAES